MLVNRDKNKDEFVIVQKEEGKEPIVVASFYSFREAFECIDERYPHHGREKPYHYWGGICIEFTIHKRVYGELIPYSLRDKKRKDIFDNPYYDREIARETKWLEADDWEDWEEEQDFLYEFEQY